MGSDATESSGISEKISEVQESGEGDEKVSTKLGRGTWEEFPGRLNHLSTNLDKNENRLSIKGSIESSLDREENESSFQSTTGIIIYRTNRPIYRKTSIVYCLIHHSSQVGTNKSTKEAFYQTTGTNLCRTSSPVHLRMIAAVLRQVVRTHLHLGSRVIYTWATCSF